MFKDRTLNFWANWLMAVVIFSAAMGLVIALASPGVRITLALFDMSPASTPTATPEVENMMRFLLGLAGGIMFGWALALGWIVHYAFRNGERWAWIAIAASVLGWFAVDSAMSIATGLYANVLGNIFFLILFEIPLAATYNKMVRWPLQPEEVTA